VPPEWLSGDGRVLSVVYKAFLIKASELPTPIALQLDDVLAVLVYDSISYVLQTSPGIEASGDDGWTFHVEVGQETEAPLGPYAVLMTHVRPDGSNEVAARDRISVAVGLLATLNGRNIVFEQLGEGEYSEATTTFYSPVIENPQAFGKPRLDRAYLDMIEEAGARIVELDEAHANRVRLALRWFDMGIHDSGVDAFLKLWFAIETLAMPDTTSIGPAEESMAAVVHPANLVPLLDLRVAAWTR